MAGRAGDAIRGYKGDAMGDDGYDNQGGGDHKKNWADPDRKKGAGEGATCGKLFDEK